MRRLGSVALVIAVFALPLVAAQSVELYPSPATEDARAVKWLFDVTLWLAIIVFVGVEALLFYIVWRFRHNKTVPAGEMHRGHTTAEVIWTIVPAVLLLGLGTVSAVTLFEIDAVPDDPDFDVRVEASQFVWTFIYDDGSRTVNQLRVEEDSRVRLNIVSKDVEHQLFIPAFAMKISAIPGRTNHEFFIAPAPGDYHLECTMYCGFGHHEMGASSKDTKVVVFEKGSQPTPYGRARPATNTTT